MRKRQLPIALLKLPAKYVTFRRKCASHCNSLFRSVSFSLHFLTRGAICARFSPDDRHRIGPGYFFSMKIAALIHRRYMPLVVMLMQ
jgi:hypothetical protein